MKTLWADVIDDAPEPEWVTIIDEDDAMHKSRAGGAIAPRPDSKRANSANGIDASLSKVAVVMSLGDMD